MPREIAVYAAERECGLAGPVRAGVSLAYAMPVEAADVGPVDAARLRSLAAATAGAEPADDFDLFHIRDVLVSTSWNSNDDVFLKDEVWPARATSVDKPFNFEHDQADIIGHIVSSRVVDAAMVEVADDAALDDVPDLIHVVNGSVIYRHIGSKERQAFIEQTIAQIRKGEWYVSMEVFLSAFDYAVETPEGDRRVIARSADTAWMTKYLRAYPPKAGVASADKYLGTGRFRDPATGSEFRIGRVVRGLTFCGKGLVRRPANPDSVILGSGHAWAPSAAACAGPGYSNPNVDAGYASHQETQMSEPIAEVADLKAQLAEAREAARKSAQDLADLRSQNHEAAVASLKAELAAKTTEAEGLVASMTAVEATVAALTARAEAAEADLTGARGELARLEGEKAVAGRKAHLKSLHAPDDEVDQVVANLEALDDGRFRATAAILAKAWRPAARPAAPTPTAPEAAVDNAVEEPEPALAAADDDRERSVAAVSEYFGKFLGCGEGPPETKVLARSR
jgi:hypothetical protein